MHYADNSKALALMPAAVHLGDDHARGDAAAAGRNGQGADSFEFADLLDVVNPLQHIPGVSSVYREITGDSIDAPARVAGGALFGGPVGFVASVFETIVAEASGDDIGGHMMAAVFGGDSPDAAGATAVAESAPPPEAKPAQQAAAATPATAQASREASGQDPGEPAVAANSAASQRPNAGLLTGDAALAALAADLRGQASGPAESQGQNSRTANATPDDVAGEQSGAAASGNPVVNGERPFLPIRESDYNHSATLRARSVEKMRAASEPAADDRGADPSHAALAGTFDEARRASPGDGPPADFAQRMKQALEKYRAMHEDN